MIAMRQAKVVAVAKRREGDKNREIETWKELQIWLEFLRVHALRSWTRFYRDNIRTAFPSLQR